MAVPQGNPKQEAHQLQKANIPLEVWHLVVRRQVHTHAGWDIPPSCHPQGHGGDNEVDMVAAALDAIKIEIKEEGNLAGDNELAAGIGEHLWQFWAVTWEVRRWPQTGTCRD